MNRGYREVWAYSPVQYTCLEDRNGWKRGDTLLAWHRRDRVFFVILRDSKDDKVVVHRRGTLPTWAALHGMAPESARRQPLDATLGMCDLLWALYHEGESVFGA